jgi:23S rRNA-/tRNA-specific pseudouridylate synthase/SAM-dependent methyltransferase
MTDPTPTPPTPPSDPTPSGPGPDDTPSGGPSQIRRSRLGGPLNPSAPPEAQLDPQSDAPSPPPRQQIPRQGPSGPPYRDQRPQQNRGPRPSFNQRPERPQQSAPRPNFAPQKLNIIYEDAQLIAIDKPPHLPVIGEDDEPNVIDLLRMQLRIRRLDRGPWTLHQIEQTASGVVVLARTPAARDALLKSRRFERYYLALVAGGPAEPDAPENGTINSQQQGRDSSEVRNLITHYQRLGVKDGAALLKLRPRTDARGQVDRHLHSLKAEPVQDKPRNASGLHLHEVTLTHPTTEARLRITAPPPAWMFERVGLEPPEGARTINDNAPTKTQSWDEVAEWYADLLTSSRNDLQTDLVWPGVTRLLEPLEGTRILDIACGEGSFARKLAGQGAKVTGIDTSEKLIEMASKLHDPDGPESRFMVADAQSLDTANLGTDLGTFDAACSILALMNIEDIEAVMRSVSNALTPGGCFVAVILHPSFRSPRRTAWGWEGRDARTQQQFRRVDAYMSETPIEIIMNPGAVAQGDQPVTTTTFVRPLQSYVQAFATAGLLIDTIEEWTSLRESEPGPRAAEENRARKEFPMFLAIRAVKPAD